MDNKLALLQDMHVLTVQTVEKIIEGCRNVKQEKDIHQDAKDLATQVIRDCNNLLSFIQEKQNETTNPT